MVRVLKNVNKIIIHPTNITFLSPDRFRAVPRDDWTVVINGVKQVQNPAHSVPSKAILFMDDKINCRVYLEDKTVLCGGKKSINAL